MTDSETTPTLYIVDGSAYIYRAYYGMRRRLSNSAGLPTNAIYAFVNMIKTLIEQEDPDYLAVTFDRYDEEEDGKSFRHELYEDYKANRDAMPDLAKLHNIGHLALGARNPEGLVSILTNFFGVPVKLQQFVGSWLTLEPDDQWQLGQPAALGRSTSIGQKVWTRGAKFRLRIGPLSRAEFERLLPGGDSLDRLRAIVRNYVGDSLDWDVNLVLAGDEIPRASLGGTTRLGHTSWVTSRRDDDLERPDAEDLFLYPGAIAENRPGTAGGHRLGRALS